MSLPMSCHATSVARSRARLLYALTLTGLIGCSAQHDPSGANAGSAGVPGDEMMPAANAGTSNGSGELPQGGVSGVMPPAPSPPEPAPDPGTQTPPNEPGQKSAINLVWSKVFGTGVENGEISPDGELIALGVEEGDSTGAVHLVRTQDASLVRRIVFVESCTGTKCNEVESLSWSADGKLLAVGGNQQPLKVFDTGSGETVFSLKTRETDGMRASPSGGFFAIADGGKLLILDTADLKIRTTLAAHSCGINSVDFTPDGSTMITGACDHKLVIWNAGDEFTKQNTIDTDGSVKTARITADGRFILVATGDTNSISIYERDGKRVAQVPLAPHLPGFEPYVDHAEFSPDGSSFVTQGKGPNVLEFSVPAGALLSTTPSAGNGEFMHWRGQKLLVVSSDGRVSVFATD